MLTTDKRSRVTSFPRWLRYLLLVATAIRLAVAAHAPLSADEAYYWIWSKVLSPGYLDHPPMVALWIRLGTLVAGDTPLGVRLFGPVSALLGTLLLMSAAEDFWPGRRAGLVAACLLNATLALNVGAVVMTPDTPLLFFWTASLAAIGRLIRTENPNWWLAIGVLAGLAMDSKYTAALLGISLCAWVLLIPSARKFLRCRQFWAAGALALLVFSPVLWWNATHHFVSFAKQGGRTGDWHPLQAVRHLTELLGGQIGLATPWVAWIFGLALIFAAQGFLRREPRFGFLACVTLLPAAIFLQHAFGGRVQANWPAIIFPGAALAAAGLPKNRFWPHASALGFCLAGAVFLQAAATPFALPRRLDFTLIRLAGWSDFAGQVFVAQTRANLPFVAADEYGLASELAYRLHGEVVSGDPRWALFDTLPALSVAGRSGLLVRSDRDLGDPDPHLWSNIVKLGHLVRGRAGVVAETYRLYRVTGAPGSTVALLPRSRNLTLN